MWESKKQYLLMDRRRRLKPAIDLMPPTPTSSQTHQNEHLSNSISLKSNSQFRIQQHFSTKFLPSRALGSVLNL